MPEPTGVRVARVYDQPDPDDGVRILVDRLWPRGLSKQAAAFDQWSRSVAPSDELRKWYGHDPDRFAEFAARYRAELAEPERASALAELRELCAQQTVTLLTASRDLDLSHACVLAQALRARPAAG